MSETVPFNPEIIKKIMFNSVENTLTSICNVDFTQEPDFEERGIIEYRSKMRTFGLEKFNAPCYLASVNLYENDTKEASGVVVIYIEDETVVELLRGMGPGVDEDDSETIRQKTGELCKAIAESIKTEMVNQLGYAEPPTMSEPITAKNDIETGVDFAFKEQKYYEASFYIKKTKAFVLAFSVAPSRKT